LLSAYGWGAAGLSERYEAATTTTYAYTFDPSGNLLQRHTNNTANGGNPIYADYSTLYDGFGGQRGAVTSRSGYALVNQDPVGWGGQFGGYTDQETVTPPGAGTDPQKRFPLVLLGHRYYDPGAGRFLNRDPVGMDGGVNVYSYCLNNPVNHIDPDGKDGTVTVTVLDTAEKVASHGYVVPVEAVVAQQTVTRVVEKKVANKISKSAFLLGAAKIGVRGAGKLAAHLAGPVGVALTIYDILDTVHSVAKAGGDSYLELIRTSPEQIEADQPISGFELRYKLSRIAKSIADGHAFYAHVAGMNEFDHLRIRTHKQFADFIYRIMRTARGANVRLLGDKRKAYWDPASGTIVLSNPHDLDLGTAYYSQNGRAGFDELH